jgi:hypothetical protein
MKWEIIIALIIAVPIILFPAAYVWHTNSGGFFRALKDARARHAAHQNEKNND